MCIRDSLLPAHALAQPTDSAKGRKGAKSAGQPYTVCNRVHRQTDKQTDRQTDSVHARAINQ
eukprot:3824844-Rhodomonas_salina.6